MGGLSLQNPTALTWLVPLAGIIILLYLLKMRRRDVRVPATFLWPDKVEEIRANSLFQRLRFSWLLVLQLVALGFIVVSMARPQTQQRGLTGEATVIIVDSSASMGAADVKPSRFAEAKRIAAEAIQSSRAGDRVALIEAGPTPRVVFSLSNDPAKQLQSLESLKQTDAETDVGEALRLASALVGNLEGARIVLLSDGCFDKVTNFSRGKAALVYRSIGDLADNLSISALGTAETPSGRQLYCGVKNHGLAALDGTLTLYADGTAVDSVKIPAIAPNSQWGRTIAAPAGTKVFEAKLESDDVLKSDNYAVALSTPGASLHVLLVSRGDIFTERALVLDPRVTLDRSTQVPEDTGKYDIVVFDGVPEQQVSARSVLTLGSAGPSSPVAVQGAARSPSYVSAENRSITEGFDLNGVFIDRYEVVEPKPDSEVLIESDKGPLLVVREKPEKRQVYLSFEPLQSDFPLQVAFPIFIANALDFLGGNGKGTEITVRAGSPFSLPTTEAAVLEGPSGKFEIKPLASNLIVREAKRIGPHTLSTGGQTRTVYSYLRSDRESSVRPEKDLALGGGTVKATESPMRFGDFWRPLALLCLLVLACEWWLYARKS